MLVTTQLSPFAVRKEGGPSFPTLLFCPSKLSNLAICSARINLNNTPSATSTESPVTLF
ncbi:hypothetical protein BDQ12DRAFT_693243 [Crucibulum laeve]|uniref:Uncharacterized protein n=1 Tax=Crucibulum laeve TaxID=68775 RepID=A0A5C3LGX5_9AGAR|nr:hypothetical protein BDQ12DRAFT_693243 [Crucibulum laeve]